MRWSRVRRRLKRAGVWVLILGVFLSVLALVATRSWCLRTLVLPRVSRAVGMPITAESIWCWPTSCLELSGLQVGAAPSPLLRAKTVRVRYALLPLLRSELRVTEVLAEGMQAQLIQDATGKWNLPPASSSAPRPATPSPQGKRELPIRPWIRNVQVRDFSFTFDQQSGSTPTHASLTAFSLTTPEVRLGAPLRLDWEGNLALTHGKDIQLQTARLAGSLSAVIGVDLSPGELAFEQRLTGLTGQVRTIPLTGREVAVKLRLTPRGTAIEVRELQLTETRDGEPEMALAVTGSVQAQPLDAMLDIRLDPMSPRAFELIGAVAGGMSFGKTSATYEGKAKVRGGTELSSRGVLCLSQATVVLPGSTAAPTPPLNLTVTHDLSLNLPEQRLTLSSLTLGMSPWREGRPDRGTEGKPDALISLRGTAELKTTTLDLDVTADPLSPAVFNLAGALAGGRDLGQTNGTYKAHVSVRQGTEATARGELRLNQFSIRSPGLQLPALGPLTIDMAHDVTVDRAGKSARLAKLNATVREADNQIASLELSEPTTVSWAAPGQATPQTSPAKLRLALNKLNLALAAPFLPSEGPVSIVGGTLSADLTAEVSEAGQSLKLNGAVAADEVALGLQGRRLPALSLREKVTAELQNSKDLVASVATDLSVGGTAALRVETDAKLDIAAVAGEIGVRVPLANERLLALIPDAGKTAALVRSLGLDAEVKTRVADGGNRIAATGQVNVPSFQVMLQDGTLVPAVQERLAFDVALDLKRKQAEIGAFSAETRQRDRPVISLTLQKPTAVSWAPEVTANDRFDSELRLDVDRMDLATLNPFLAATKTVFTSGTVSAGVGAQVSRLGQAVQVRGTVTLADVAADTPQGRVKELSVTEAFEVGFTDLRHLEIRKLSLALLQAGADALRTEVSGKLDTTETTGRFEVQVPVLNERLLQALPAELGRKVPSVRELSGSAGIVAELRDGGKVVASQGKLELSKVTVADKAYAQPFTLRSSLAFEVGTQADGDIRLRSVVFDLADPTKPLVNLGLKGQLRLPLTKGESVLNLESKGMDLKALADLTAPPPAATDGAAPATPPPAQPQPAGEPGAVDLGGLWLTTNLDLTNIRYGEVVLSEVRGAIRVRDNRVEVMPVDLVVNGGTVHVEAQADLGKPGYVYKLAQTGKGIPLAPFVGTFAPALKDRVTGNLKGLDLTAAGAGITTPSLTRNLAGGAELTLDGLTLENLPAVAAAAAKYGIPELQKLEFNGVTLRAVAEGGRVTFRDGTAVGRDLRLVLGGAVWFDQRLELELQVAVAGALEARLREKGLGALLNQRDKDYAVLPLALPVGGTLTRPTPDVGKFLSQLFKQAGVNVLGSVVKSVTEGKKVDGKALLNDLLGTPAADGKATPAPAAQENQRGPEAPQTEPAAPAPAPAKSKKQQREDALRELGTGVLKNLMNQK